MSVAVYDGDKVAELLDRASLIEALAVAFRGGFEAPARHHHAIPVVGGADATMLLMPAWDSGRYIGTKVVNVFPGNGAIGLASVQSLYVLFSGTTGAPVALLDGAELTTRRTVAASSLAARYLSRGDASRLLIVGTGQVARQVAASHAAVCPIREVTVWGRDDRKVQLLVEQLRGEGFESRGVTDLKEAASAADIISCCTLSRTALIEGSWLRPGVHLDLIGGFTPWMREVDGAAAARSVIAVDTFAAVEEAGDLVAPLADGTIQREDIVTDLHGLVTGRHPGRLSAGERTLFKSVGAAIEDLAAAILCHERAIASGDTILSSPIARELSL